MKVILAAVAATLLVSYIEAVCMDKYAHCDLIKKQNWCETREDYSKYWCEKTCGFCGTTPTTSGPTGPPTPAPPIPTHECGVSQVHQSRVVNGYKAKEGAWPWIASLQRSYGGHFCGGTLIAPNWILTASHCVSFIHNPSDFKVVMGAHNRANDEPSQQSRPMKRVIMHPQYNRNTLFADHALIEVEKPFQLNKRVVLGCMPKSQVPIGTQSCYIAGWGTTTHPGNVPDILMQARMPVVPSVSCRYNPEVVCVGFGKITDPNACRGDSGGPLMCRNSDNTWTVHGVASFVVEYCKYYTGYSPVSKYLSWIGKYVPQYKQHQV